ncbi:hypothetical protein RAAC3_TM7C00001G0834 [Candidatus Saccharibacteria bacterium RAAC3_TM7_1]|nr:hypothetical protein RAAC3_TM7C00001G0834 [Candidatus Saccharibacteria bacterium RAAC3_TM7_1]HCZ28468.1 hypothetical protein [Candidatus Saccharibacteria bacterium]
MSTTRSRPTTITRWLIGFISLGIAGWLWLNHQYVIDLIHYNQYTPSAAVESVASKARLTGDGKFLFYASEPEIAGRSTFNARCERKEANSPILGCYSLGRIYIFNVTSDQLDGIQAVTAAHEMLHAAYDRLSQSEKDRLKPLLEAAYQRVKTTELETRMAYYNKNEPGQGVNELHSILGTEFTNLGGELERYYERYFTNRASLVALHSSVQSVFTSLSNKADSLLKQANALADTINTATKKYNLAVAQLNEDVAAFNARAQRSGGFNDQAELDSARSALIARSDVLDATRQQIKADITTYDSLVAQLKIVSAETISLNKSIDSTLSETPAL